MGQGGKLVVQPVAFERPRKLHLHGHVLMDTVGEALGGAFQVSTHTHIVPLAGPLVT
jgi:hypothetical protein